MMSNVTSDDLVKFLRIHAVADSPDLSPPQIRFVYLGLHLYSALPSDAVRCSRPCASLKPFPSIWLIRGLSPPSWNMLGLPKNTPRHTARAWNRSGAAELQT